MLFLVTVGTVPLAYDCAVRRNTLLSFCYKYLLELRSAEDLGIVGAKEHHIHRTSMCFLHHHICHICYKVRPHHTKKCKIDMMIHIKEFTFNSRLHALLTT